VAPKPRPSSISSKVLLQAMEPKLTYKTDFGFCPSSQFNTICCFSAPNLFPLNGNNIINLNFADDTLIFLKTDFKMMDALKLLLQGFENMSGLKINFTKSELISLNISTQDGQQLAHILKCKVDTLLITYLGTLLHWKKNKNL
jgi:hypothetical protein